MIIFTKTVDVDLWLQLIYLITKFKIVTKYLHKKPQLTLHDHTDGNSSDKNESVEQNSGDTCDLNLG